MITVTHALKELKLLEGRISKRIAGLQVIRVRRASEATAGGLTAEQFAQEVLRAYQGIQALIARRAGIKAAVVHSNAVTEVRVGDEVMTVAAAVERKRSLESHKLKGRLMEPAATLDALIGVLSSQHAQAVNEEALLRAQITRDSEARVAAFLSGDKGKDKNAGTDPNTQELERLYRESNAPVIDDPLRLLTGITALREAAETFASEVDRVLDEKNATTTIVVPASV